MKLYEILLPVYRNNCGHYKLERADFLRRLETMAGGYTLCPIVEGAWHDNGETQIEDMIPVRVACDPQVWRNIVSLALVTFADQKSILWYVLADDVTFASRNAALEECQTCAGYPKHPVHPLELDVPAALDALADQIEGNRPNMAETLRELARDERDNTEEE